MSRRWPLHPEPIEGEALSSWLGRTAQAYGMDAEELMLHNLPGAQPRHPLDGVDADPPAALLEALGERTGVPIGRLRRMTLEGWVPWLIEPGEPTPGLAFAAYVHQDSLLLAARHRPRRLVPGWRPWLPLGPTRAPMRRACPACIDAAPHGMRVFTLASQLPLTLSCPEHGCRLEPAHAALGGFFMWEKPETAPTGAPGPVVQMDRRTHEALRTGNVSLPRRRVHAGVWFRLLRTLIDELSAPLTSLPAQPCRILRGIWQACGHPLRAGDRGPWRPFEKLDWPRQQATLEAAATALHLIETEEIAARGSLAALLTPEPHRPVPDGTPPPPRRTARGRTPPGPAPHLRWRLDWDEAVATATAGHDPRPARRVLELVAHYVPARTEQTRRELLAVGVPEMCKAADMAQWIGRRIGYARSTAGEDLAAQVGALGDVHRMFEENHSGAARAGRTALAEMIGYAQDGDTVVVSSMDRLGRSVADLNQVVGELLAKGVVVEFINEQVTFTPGAADPFAEFQLHLMESFAQLERAIAKERQADGIRAARARGAYKGRARALNAQQLAEAQRLIAEGGQKAAVARHVGVDRSTLYRALERANARS